MGTLKSKKIIIVFVRGFLLLALPLIILSLFLFWPRGLTIYEEYKAVDVKRDTTGILWEIINSEEMEKEFYSEYKIHVPDNDYSKYFLLWADGRRLKKVTYNLGSKYFDSQNRTYGNVVFMGKHFKNKAFFYIIETKFIHSPP